MFYIRWLLVLPAAWVGFYLGLLIAIFSFQSLTGWCPGGTITSGHCSVSWVNQLPFIIGAAFAPPLVLYLGTTMAPNHRVAVAWALYFGGAVIGLLFFRKPLAVLVAGVTGAITALLLVWREKSKAVVGA